MLGKSVAFQFRWFGRRDQGNHKGCTYNFRDFTT